MANKEVTLEGIIIAAIHYTTEDYSDITIKTTENKEYSFKVMYFDFLKDHKALRINQIIKIAAIIDVKTNEIIGINEIWSKVKIRQP